MKIDTKYSPDDMVWIMKDNKAVEVKVYKISIIASGKDTFVNYSIEMVASIIFGGMIILPGYEESQLYKTKQELLDSL